jgi:hypothetical protein
MAQTQEGDSSPAEAIGLGNPNLIGGMVGSLECYFFANDNTYTNLPFFFGREEFLYSSTAGEHSIYCF